MSTPPNSQGFAKKRLLLILLGGLAGIGAGVAGIYGMGAVMRNAAVPEACRPAAALARSLEPLARGEVAALSPAKIPVQVAGLAFQDADGKPRKLADFANKTVLLNLWATWCVPCKKEMPALDELQKKLGGSDFEVVAVNIDTRDPQKPKTWLKDTGIASLSFYADPTARIFQDLKEKGRAFGMPTTILMDREGCEIGAMAGAAEWASEDAVKLIAAAINP